MIIAVKAKSTSHRETLIAHLETPPWARGAKTRRVVKAAH